MYLISIYLVQFDNDGRFFLPRMPYAQAAWFFMCAHAQVEMLKKLNYVQLSAACVLRHAAKYEPTFSETSNVTMTLSFSFKTIKLEFSVLVHEYFYMNSNRSLFKLYWLNFFILFWQKKSLKRVKIKLLNSDVTDKNNHRLATGIELFYLSHSAESFLKPRVSSKISIHF